MTDAVSLERDTDVRWDAPHVDGGDDSRATAPTERKVDVSVLVPVLNEAAHIRETASAMRAQRFDGRLELLFMDGGSDDGTRAILDEIAAADARVRVLDNPARRTADGLNVGLANARGEFVARMDAHAIYPPNYLALGVERLRRGDVDWVAGPAVPRGSGTWSRRVALALNSGLATVGSRKWRTTTEGRGGEVELDTGVWAGVWRHSTLEKLGGWDAGWPVNQDSELAARVLEAGGRIVLLPEMAATYFPRDDLQALARQYARYGYYRAKTACRHPHSARRSHVLAPALALALVSSAAAPQPVSRLSRLALGAYATSLGAMSAQVALRTRDRDALTLPAVAALMHLSWGFGYLWGSARHGPPLAAAAHVAGVRRPG
jgi:succinoglycan biosynthesis protein ExoA